MKSLTEEEQKGQPRKGWRFEGIWMVQYKSTKHKNVLPVERIWGRKKEGEKGGGGGGRRLCAHRFGSLGWLARKVG